MSELFVAPAGYRAGFVTLIGRPNVGKSSLVNAMVGEDLAPISPVPQTTRRRLLGILSTPSMQAVFVDTPGVHAPEQRLGEAMLDSARKALVDADLVLCVVDCTRSPGAEDELALQIAAASAAPKFLVINKTDLAGDSAHVQAFQELHGLDDVFLTSAVTGDGLPALVAAIEAKLPESPPFYPPDQVSDAMEREIAAELIREALLQRLQAELPHAVAVKVETWQERPNGMLYVQANVYVERDSQKGIVIGKGGAMLRTVGTLAREKLEHWLQQRVYLELRVKVLKDWRRHEHMLRFLGFMRE